MMCYNAVAMIEKDQNINIRLDVNLKRRAEQVAANCGSTLSVVIRLLLERLIEHADRHGGKIVMPPDFVEYDIKRKSQK